MDSIAPPDWKTPPYYREYLRALEEKNELKRILSLVLRYADDCPHIRPIDVESFFREKERVLAHAREALQTEK